MTSRLHGWDLPPGCSRAEIERSLEGREGPEVEQTCALLAQLAGGPQQEETGAGGQPQTPVERIVEIVDNLAIERDNLKRLLREALPYLPARGPAPPCTCAVEQGVRIEGPTYCYRHDGDWDEPTLREAVEDAIKETPL